MSHTVSVRHHVVTSTFIGDKHVLRTIKRAAGAASCDASRPGQLIVYGSKVDKALAALADAGIDVQTEAP